MSFSFLPPIIKRNVAARVTVTIGWNTFFQFNDKKTTRQTNRSIKTQNVFDVKFYDATKNQNAFNWMELRKEKNVPDFADSGW